MGVHDDLAPAALTARAARDPGDALRAAEILVVGAGPAGLATAACLHRLGLAPVVVERAPTVAASWRRHYDRLHLHTTRRLSTLPLGPWPADAPRYPSRDAVVEYVTAYARRHRIAPMFGVAVGGVRRAGGRFVVETTAGPSTPRSVVVATGANAVATWPALAGLERFGERALHARDYRTAAPFAGCRTLVVGCGSSGAEIALDLAEHGVEVSIAVRGPVHVVPRDIAGVPTQAISVLLSPLPASWRDALVAPVLGLTVGDLSSFGVTRPAQGPYRMVERTGRIPVIDVGTLAAVRSGRIHVRPGIDAVLPDAVRFVDGTSDAFDAVVCATGYRHGLESIVDAGILQVGALGVPMSVPEHGLFFVGYRSPATGVLREIGREARRASAAIATRHGASVARAGRPQG